MNETIDTDWGYISYLADSSANPLGEFLDSMFVAMTGTDVKSTEETAIVVKGAGREGREAYYILYGDWRDVLRGKSLPECVKVFLDNPDHHGHTTDHPKEGNIIFN